MHRARSEICTADHDCDCPGRRSELTAAGERSEDTRNCEPDRWRKSTGAPAITSQARSRPPAARSSTRRMRRRCRPILTPHHLPLAAMRYCRSGLTWPDFGQLWPRCDMSRLAAAPDDTTRPPTGLAVVPPTVHFVTVRLGGAGRAMAISRLAVPARTRTHMRVRGRGGGGLGQMVGTCRKWSSERSMYIIQVRSAECGGGNGGCLLSRLPGTRRAAAADQPFRLLFRGYFYCSPAAPAVRTCGLWQRCWRRAASGSELKKGAAGREDNTRLHRLDCFRSA